MYYQPAVLSRFSTERWTAREPSIWSGPTVLTDFHIHPVLFSHPPPMGYRPPNWETTPPPSPTQCNLFWFLMQICASRMLNTPKHLSIPPNFKFLEITLHPSLSSRSSLSLSVLHRRDWLTHNSLCFPQHNHILLFLYIVKCFFCRSMIICWLCFLYTWPTFMYILLNNFLCVLLLWALYPAGDVIL